MSFLYSSGIKAEIVEGRETREVQFDETNELSFILVFRDLAYETGFWYLNTQTENIRP